MKRDVLNTKVGILVSILLFTWVSNAHAGPIKIGVAGAHSGDLKRFGLPTVHAAELAADEINSAGGILGQPVELVVMNDQCKPEIAVQVATRLANAGVVAVIGHTCSGATKAALAIYKSHDIIAISPSATNPALTRSGEYPIFFRTIDADDRQSEVQVAFILETLKAQRIAIIHDGGDYGKGMAESARSRLQAARGDIVVLYDSLTPKGQNTTTIVNLIRRSGADTVIFGGYHPEAAKIVTELERADLKVNFLACDGVKHDKFIQASGHGAEGTYVTGLEEKDQFPLARQAIARHQSKYGKAPGPFFLNAYGAFTALAKAIESADTTRFADVARALRENIAETPMGPLQFDRHGDLRQSNFTIYQVQNGGFRPLRQMSPALQVAAPDTRPASTPSQSPTGSPASAAPRIEIVTPDITRGVQVTATGKRTTVAGRALSSAGVVEVLVNGREANLDGKGNFSCEVLLKPGQNTIRVTALDVHEKRATRTFTLTREVSGPASPAPPAVASPSPSRPIGNGNHYAIVIGIDNYTHLPRLQTARKDARAVAAVLEKEFGFTTRLLLDANRRDILKAINTYRKQATPEDHFLLYYAGHGEFDKVAQRAYWLPVEASAEDDIDWIIVDTLTSNLRRIRAKHILVVADSCYSGTLTRSSVTHLDTETLRTRYLEKMRHKSSRTLIASGGNEPVADGGGQGHSVFALAFIEGLQEMTPSVFTAEELFYDSIKERVAGNARQTPEYNTIRNSGHNGGDFLFFRRP